MALLDGSHTPRSMRMADPKLKDEWCADDVAKVCGATYFSTAHLLERQKKYGIVSQMEVTGKTVFMTKAGEKAEIPVTTKIWTLTPKGKDRLARRGGHDAWCPICSEAAR